LKEHYSKEQPRPNMSRCCYFTFTASIIGNIEKDGYIWYAKFASYVLRNCRGTDQEIEFQEIEIDIFQKIESLNNALKVLFDFRPPKKYFRSLEFQEIESQMVGFDLQIT